MPALDATLEQENFQQQQAQQAYDFETSQKAVQRQLRQIKRQTTTKAQQASQEVFKKIAQKVAKQAAARVTSWAAGATLIGLLVTYLIWTIQAIVGNLMGSKWIPSLEWWELILWLLLGIILLAILFGLLALLAIFLDPISIGWEITKEALWSIF